jgi:DNA-binding transcriptional LysR family regulator
MNLDTLRIFCSVVSQRSFSRGAAVNQVSQSAATQAVRRLERELGVELIDRTKRPFVLTPAGELCYEAFRELVDMYEGVMARLQVVRGEVAGVVRVGAIYSVGLHDMSHCMREFLRRYPRAQIRLEFLHPARIYEAVLSGELDLGVISYPQSSAEIDVIPLREERMVLVFSPSHRFADRTEVKAQELNGEAFIAFERGLVIRKHIERYLREHNVNVRVAMAFDNIETIKQAVEVEAGISILPEPTIRREVVVGSLRAARLIPDELVRPIGIIHHHRKVFTPAMSKFVEVLKEVSLPSPA